MQKQIAMKRILMSGKFTTFFLVNFTFIISLGMSNVRPSKSKQPLRTSNVEVERQFPTIYLH